MTQFLIKGERTQFIEMLIEADTEDDALEAFHESNHNESITSESDAEILEVIECE